jgi:pyruvate/2-oxoglutarate dehydrogenase complex dihydrolipoamide dehydrogenase (E3) component
MLMPTPPDAVKSSTPERDNLTADLCIIGAGPGGLALAASAAAYGQNVVLIEKHKMGGTSLNYGSMPAVALQASAQYAHAFRSAAPFGIAPLEPAVDRAAVAAHIAEIVEASTPNVSVERLNGLGVRVIQAAARFIDHKTLAAGEHRITARRFVVATGSSPVLPAIPGLANIPYETTDTIFAATAPIDHLVIVGAGAAGVELAQAHRRLGARVTLIDKAAVLGRFDPELAAVIKARLLSDGIVILEGTEVLGVEGTPGRLRIDTRAGNATTRIEASHLLIACGRQPSITGIGLEAAKIATTPDGIKVDKWLRTSNRRVYAIGDVTGGPHATQRAEYHAGVLIKSLLFRVPTSVDPRLIPASIHTDPEFATVGLSEAQARQAYSAIQVFRWPVRENPRAIANRAPDGHIKIIADKRGKILGAALVARSASELICVWSLAVSKGLTLDDMGEWIPPFPSLGDVTGKVAQHRQLSATGTMNRRWVRILARFS